MIALSACRDFAWYALPRTWIYRPAGERLIVRVFSAREDDPYTAAYLSLIDKAIQTPSGRFLYRPTLANLIDCNALITLVYCKTLTPHCPIAGRYVEPRGAELRFRGGFVDPVVRGRALSAAMGSLALYDHMHRGNGLNAAVSSVIVRDGLPNESSVRALGKLGFDLTDQQWITEIQGNNGDVHLLAEADWLEGKPVLHRRGLYLPLNRIAHALRFLETWQG